MRQYWMLLPLVLTGCGGKTGDPGICQTPEPLTAASLNAGTHEGDLRWCVHRWAYRLAAAPGSSAQVAPAVVTACGDEVIDAFIAKNPAPDGVDAEAYSKGVRSKALSDAVFRVTQARAGHCDIP